MEGRHGLGAGRQKQAIEGNLLAVGEHDVARADLDRGDGRVKAKVDAVVGIEALVAQRQPLLRRPAGEIVL